MKFFNVFEINYDGQIPIAPDFMGANSTKWDIIPVAEKKGNDDIHFRVYVHYEHFTNDKKQFEFNATTTYLVNGLNKNDIDRELLFMRTLTIRSISHLQGILASKFQDKGTHFRVPDDPMHLFNKMYADIDATVRAALN